LSLGELFEQYITIGGPLMENQNAGPEIQNLKTLSDNDLLSKTKVVVHQEREVTTRVLRHLREVERRRLYADLGYSSLHDFAIRELKYSNSAARRRIEAMRLLKELPEVEAKIQSGHLNLTTVLQVRSFFKTERKGSLSGEAKGTQSTLPSGFSKGDKLKLLES